MNKRHKARKRFSSGFQNTLENFIGVFIKPPLPQKVSQMMMGDHPSILMPTHALFDDTANNTNQVF